MSRPHRRRAFVSSTREDLSGHREHVIRVLQKSDFDVDPMENWTADPGTPLDISTQRVAGSDVCILLVGHRLGHIPDGQSRSITQQEYDAALREGVDVLVFLRQDDGETDGKQDAAVQEWRAALMERHTVGFFGADPSSIELAEALNRLMQRQAPQRRIACSLPQSQSPNFVGRKDVLTGLREGVLRSTTRPTVDVLTGMGGSGKSQLALEYAHRYSDRYSVVWWARADTDAGWMEDRAALATALGIRGEHDDLPAAAEAADGWLQNHSGWLLVLDNAVDPATSRGLVPSGGDGHVLVTSRNPNWGSVGKVREIGAFERLESVAFLRATAAGAPEDSDELASELGDLPLALAHARAFMEEAQISVREYLALYRGHGTAIRSRRPESSDYPTSVETTLTVSIERLAAESPRASAVVEALSLLAPDPVPLSVFETTAAEENPDTANELGLDPLTLLETQSAIRRYALAQVDGGFVTMHRLVQAVVRDGLSDEALRNILAKVCHRLGRFGPDLMVGTSHYELMVERAEGLELQPLTLLPLKVILGSRRLAAADYSGAIDVLDSALVTTGLAESLDDASDRRTTAHAIAYGRLIRANATGVVGRGEDVVPDLEWVRDQAEKWFPSEPRVAMGLLRSLTHVLRSLDLMPFEVEVAKRALEMARLTLDEDDPDLAEFIHGAASSIHSSGNPSAARLLHEEAVELVSRTRGPNDMAVVANLACLGDVMRDLGDLDRAIALRERALAICEENEGPEGESAAGVRMYLSEYYGQAGRTREALDEALRALEVYERSYGTEHPELEWPLARIAGIHQDLEEFGPARQTAQRIVDIMDRTFGPGHHRSLPAIRIVATTAMLAEDWDEVEAQAQRMLTLAPSAGRDGLTFLAWVDYLLGSALDHKYHSFEAAAERFKASAEIFRQAGGHKMAGVLLDRWVWVRHAWSYALKEEDRLEQCFTVHRETLAELDRLAVEPTYFGRIDTLNALARLEIHREGWAEVESLATQLAEIGAGSGESGAAASADAGYLLGLVHLERDEAFEIAAEHFAAAEKIYRDLGDEFWPDHILIMWTSTRERWALALEAKDRFVEAEEVYRGTLAGFDQMGVGPADRRRIEPLIGQANANWLGFRRAQEASEILERALVIIDQTDMADQSESAGAFRQAAHLAGIAGRFEKAREWTRIAIRLTAEGAIGCATSGCQQHIADGYLHCGAHALEAELMNIGELEEMAARRKGDASRDPPDD